MFALNLSRISNRLVGYWKLCMTMRSSVASVSSSTFVYNGTTRLPRGVRVMRTCTFGVLHVRTASNNVANNESLHSKTIPNQSTVCFIIRKEQIYMYINYRSFVVYDRVNPFLYSIWNSWMFSESLIRAKISSNGLNVHIYSKLLKRTHKFWRWIVFSNWIEKMPDHMRTYTISLRITFQKGSLCKT